jgi:hypothetical protein
MKGGLLHLVKTIQASGCSKTWELSESQELLFLAVVEISRMPKLGALTY